MDAPGNPYAALAAIPSSAAATPTLPSQLPEVAGNPYAALLGGMPSNAAQGLRTMPRVQPSIAPSTDALARAEFERQPWYDRAMIGAGGATVGLWHGIEQVGAELGNKVGLVSNARLRQVQQMVDDSQPFIANSQRGGWAMAGSALPYIAGALGTGGVADAVGSAGIGGDALGAAARVAASHPFLTSAAVNAGLGAIQQVPSGGSRVANAGVGALTGFLGEGVGAALGKTGNAIAGRLAPKLASAIDAATEAKVPLSVGDVGSTPARWMEAIATKVPGSGQVSAFGRQADAVQAMASRMPQDVAPNVTARVAEGEEPGDILAQAVRDNYHNTLAQSRSHYQALDEAIHQSGAAPVQPTEAKAAIGNAVKEFPGIFTQGGADLPQSTQSTLSALQKGEPVPFSDLHQARSAVLSAQRNIAPGQNRYRAMLLAKVGAAIDQDMNAWTGEAAEHGHVWEAYKNAQDYYAQHVAPFSDKEVAPLLRSDYNAQSLPNKIGPQSYNTARKLATAGGDDGAEALRFMLASRAPNAATSGEGFSVPRFANEAAKTFNGPASKAVFNAPDLQRLQAQAEVARLAKRAGISANDVQTGAQAIPFLEGLGAHAAVGSVPGAAATMGAIGVGTRLGMGILRTPAAVKFYAADRAVNPTLARLLRAGAATGSAKLIQYLNALSAQGG